MFWETMNNGHGRQISQSFRDAFRGIALCMVRERNMRIHTVAALYVFVFSFYFEMSAVRYAVLFLTFGAVMAAEIFNTSIEKLSDVVSKEYDEGIRTVKDLAAGAVLICAVFAVGVGVALFWQPAAFQRIWRSFCERPWLFGVFAGVTLLALLYIVLGPGFRRHKK